MSNMTVRPGCRTMEINGGSSASYLACTLAFPCFVPFFNRGGNRRAFRLPGEGEDHFHRGVEPSPGQIRCRIHLRQQLQPSKKSFFRVFPRFVRGFSRLVIFLFLCLLRSGKNKKRINIDILGGTVFGTNRTLSFLSLFFLKMARKPTKKQGFVSLPNP